MSLIVIFILFLNGNLTGGDTVVNVCFEALFHNAFKRFCHNLVSNFVWQQWIWICVTTMNLFVCDNNVFVRVYLFVCDNNVFVRVWQQWICSCVTTMNLFVCDNNVFVRVSQQWICSCVTTMNLFVCDNNVFERVYLCCDRAISSSSDLIFSFRYCSSVCSDL